MSFYEKISKYYDDIFPVSKEKVNFLMSFLENPPKKVIDIGCGTGGYSLELARRGCEVTAADLDDKMLDKLRRNSVESKLNIEVLNENMLNLSKSVNEKYDLAFCIGNSLVHLDGKKQIGNFFKQIRGLINKDGKLIIQIINYDRVIKKDIKSLPNIENNELGLKFIRLYNYIKDKNEVLFKTVLEIKGERMESEIRLYPLLSEDIERLLKESGFNKVKLFGDFKGNNYDKENSYALVVVAQ